MQEENNNPNQNEQSMQDLILFFSAMFEQVKLQQEVRDRWFGHFISIIGAVSALSALCFGFLSDHVSQHYLLLFIAAVFCLAGIIGILFYVLYMKQRQNYRKIYKGLAVLQDKICFSLLSEKEQQKMIVLFKKSKKGADFVTILIENVICSTCFTLSFSFALMTSIHVFEEIFISAIIVFLVAFSSLYVVYSTMEEQNYEKTV